MDTDWGGVIDAVDSQGSQADLPLAGSGAAPGADGSDFPPPHRAAEMLHRLQRPPQAVLAQRPTRGTT
jgi:hypothetical protein